MLQVKKVYIIKKISILNNNKNFDIMVLYYYYYYYYCYSYLDSFKLPLNLIK